MNRSTKQLLLLAASFLSLTINAANSDNNKCRDNCHITSHTYFSVRPQFQVGSPEFVSLTRSLKHEKRKKWGGYLQAVVFGGQSTSKSSLGTFFAPFGRNSFTVDGTIEEGSCNISPQHFNIFSTKFSDLIDPLFGNISPDKPFRSTVTLNPRQSVIGVGLSWHQGFNLCDQHFWFNVSGPVVNIENTMGFKECIETNHTFEVEPITGTNLADPKKSMNAALNQSGWCFGKIDCGKRDQTELAFIQLRIGHVTIETEHCSYEPFFGITIPTGNAPKAQYVFDPIAGNGDHFGLLWGSSLHARMYEWKKCDMRLSIASDVVAQYLFKKTQKRSFDLHYKPWSRYIELYANKAQATQASGLRNDNPKFPSIFLATPGINTMTQDVSVKPGFNFTSNMALCLETPAPHNGFNLELGYNFYAREAECLSLNKECTLDSAIKDHFGSGFTNPIRNMTSELLSNEASVTNAFEHALNTTQVLDLFDNRKLSFNDFDLQSAAHPCVISHTIYGAFNYNFRNWCWPMMIGFGGSYEFTGEDNAALERWLLWGKLGVSF